MTAPCPVCHAETPVEKLCKLCWACPTCCAKFENHRQCRVCGIVVNCKLESHHARSIWCEDCKTCISHCECKFCSACGRAVKGIASLCGQCGRCWRCCTHFGALLSHPKKRIEPMLMKLYTLQEIEAAASATLNQPEEILITRRVKVERISDLQSRVKAEINQLTRVMGELYFKYLIGASFGEMRYLGQKSENWALSPFIAAEEMSRTSQAAFAYVQHPEALLLMMRALFLHKTFSGGGFGGFKWAEICDVGLKWFEEIPRAVWLDHAVDLSHNGGLYLGKFATFFTAHNTLYKQILDKKHEGELLKSGFVLILDQATMDLLTEAEGLRLVNRTSEVQKIDPKLYPQPRDTGDRRIFPFLTHKGARITEIEAIISTMKKLKREAIDPCESMEHTQLIEKAFGEGVYRRLREIAANCERVPDDKVELVIGADEKIDD